MRLEGLRTTIRAVTEPAPDVSPAGDPRVAAATARYWRSNRRFVVVLILLWAFSSLGCGVLLADWLDQWHVGGAPLGFWFAQQGSILTFVLLILAYAVLMARLDARHRRELAELGR